MRDATTKGRRGRSRTETIDTVLEAQLQTELSLRRAERFADRARGRAQREATRRFLVVLTVLVGLLSGFGYLIFKGLAGVFS